MKVKSLLVWFRQDLRLHDNESLNNASNFSSNILPVYVFDKRLFESKSRFGFRKIDVGRASFLIESVENLRKNLQSKGSNLLVRYGIPEDIIFDLTKSYGCSLVFCNRERTHEEEKVQDKLEKNLWSVGHEIFYNRGKLLYYTSDLPFPIGQTPDSFNQFRKEVEKIITIREPLEVPENIVSNFENIDWGEIPSLEEMGFSQEEISSYKPIYRGGEDAGLEIVDRFFWKDHHALNFKKTKSSLFGDDVSTSFSPWLSLGCISPKLIYRELCSFEEEIGKNDSTYQIYHSLLLRDYFRLIAKKYGNKIYQFNGIRKAVILDELSADLEKFSLVQQAQTGIPIIDAAVKELNSTGFLSSRARAILAGFIVFDLKINWLIGAEFFESKLIDYDTASNYGNWQHLVGIGADNKQEKHINVISQSKRFDLNTEYIVKWLPELNKIDELELRHTPWKLGKSKSFNLDVDYYAPIQVL